MSNDPGRKPNRLLHETSPYLQQHAYNPVDWYPWGPEALQTAKELDRPIFLSIGYSSCHWCHVMERESFENEAIAKLMNEHFVNIKVDREERPDIDQIYMTAVQMLTGSGGWPMSVFLTPDLKPFWGGTYFPPDSRYGRPGFNSILTQIAETYRTGRDRVENAASQITGHLQEEVAVEPASDLPGPEAMGASVEHARRTFDRQNGGFGPAPKFPRSIELSMLLRQWERNGEPEVLAMCETTLERMAQGGLYDQVGGGFHRYSTDERWLVPHFEKMLYDNALLARTYLEAYQATGKELHARVAREVLDYVLREMTSPEGGFYSATDADSEGEEGKFFVWTPEEVEKVLGESDARLFCEFYDITKQGNFEHGASIPNVVRPVEALARLLKLDVRAIEDSLARSRRALHAARESRVKPFRDEKILAAWNGLMISALSRGYQVLGDPRYLAAAETAARFVLEKLCPDGKLHRVYKDGRCQFPAYLDDHAFLCEALLDLYESTFRLEHLARARSIADALLRDFWDAGHGGCFFTSARHEGLIARKKDALDNATPSGNGVAILSLLRLERLTGDSAYRDKATALLKAVSRHLEKLPMAMGSTIIALDFLLHPPVEIAVVGELADASTQGLLRTVHARFLPRKVLAQSPAPVTEETAAAVPLLRSKGLVKGKPAAYVCRNFACQAPVAEPIELEKLLGRPTA